MMHILHIQQSHPQLEVVVSYQVEYNQICALANPLIDNRDHNNTWTDKWISIWPNKNKFPLPLKVFFTLHLPHLAYPAPKFLQNAHIRSSGTSSCFSDSSVEFVVDSLADIML
jgi:hypothetical protein